MKARLKLHTDTLDEVWVKAQVKVGIFWQTIYTISTRGRGIEQASALAEEKLVEYTKSGFVEGVKEVKV